MAKFAPSCTEDALINLFERSSSRKQKAKRPHLCHCNKAVRHHTAGNMESFTATCVSGCRGGTQDGIPPFSMKFFFQDKKSKPFGRMFSPLHLARCESAKVTSKLDIGSSREKRQTTSGGPRPTSAPSPDPYPEELTGLHHILQLAEVKANSATDPRQLHLRGG